MEYMDWGLELDIYTIYLIYTSATLVFALSFGTDVRLFSRFWCWDKAQ